jgi:hypothetical protein
MVYGDQGDGRICDSQPIVFREELGIDSRETIGDSVA